LIALRSGEPIDIHPIQIQPNSENIRATTPVSAAILGGGGGNKRKRGLGEISLSPIPTSSPQRHATPHIIESNNHTPASPMLGGSGSGRGGTPLGGLGFSKIKKERDGKDGKEGAGGFADQLPLLPGRKVVFRTPESSAANGDVWILCTVKRHLGDKIRYELYDVDDTEPKVYVQIHPFSPILFSLFLHHFSISRYIQTCRTKGIQC